LPLIASSIAVCRRPTASLFYLLLLQSVHLLMDRLQHIGDSRISSGEPAACKDLSILRAYLELIYQPLDPIGRASRLRERGSHELCDLIGALLRDSQKLVEGDFRRIRSLIFDCLGKQVLISLCSQCAHIQSQLSGHKQHHCLQVDQPLEGLLPLIG